MRLPRSGPAEVANLIEMLRREAQAGNPCPSNMDVAAHFGFSSVASAARLFQLAERAGLIVVERGQAARVVSAADGTWRTAGTVGAPHWRMARGAAIAMRAADGDWTDADIVKLRALWPRDDLSIAQIGEQLGRSKNSVAGQAFRLKLPPRRSGKRSASVGASAQVQTQAPGVPTPDRGTVSRPVAGGTSPAGASPVVPRVPAGHRDVSPPPAIERSQALPPRTGSGALSAHASSVVLTVRRREPLPVLGQRTPGTTCRWPLWKFGAKPDMRFCDAPRDSRCRSPYCAQHAEKARSKHAAAA